MCGVIGLIQKSRNDAPLKALSALKVMEYRGYDSWGVAWGSNVTEKRATAYKQVGQIGTALLPKTAVGKQALGHTRWATHGGVTVQNAHPHLSRDHRFALVHNGVLENFQTLKTRHQQANYSFISETDTEVILATWEAAFLQQIEKHHDQPIQQLLQAARDCFLQLEGSNAIVVMDYVSGYGVAVRTGSPLIVGRASDSYCVVSDVLALVGSARSYTTLDEGEIVIFNASTAEFYQLDTLKSRVKKWLVLELTSTEVSKGKHAHFMHKEIAESGQVLATLLTSRSFQSKLSCAVADLADTLYLVGCGTAYHAALYGATLITSKTDKIAFAFSANEFDAWVDKITSGSVIFISQSGETADVLVHARKLHERGITFTAMVNREQSSLAELAHHSIPCMAGPEQAVVASKSFIAQLGVLQLLVAELSQDAQLKRAVKQSLQLATHEIAYLVTQLPIMPEWCDLVAKVSKVESVYILGRGVLHPLALEIALKLKEAAYIHAEGFSAGELKHGVLALVQTGTPVISLATESDTQALDSASIQEVKAREGDVSIVTDHAVADHDALILIKQIGIATPLLVAVVGQLLAYTIACVKAIDPDKPRNLAKSVTVR